MTCTTYLIEFAETFSHKNGTFKKSYLNLYSIIVFLSLSQSMKAGILYLLLITAILFSCKSKTAGNLEEMARRSSRPEAVLVKTLKLEPSVFYHELISNGKAWSSEKAVVPFKVNGIISGLFIKNGQKVRAGSLIAVIGDFEFK